MTRMTIPPSYSRESLRYLFCLRLRDGVLLIQSRFLFTNKNTLAVHTLSYGQITDLCKAVHQRIVEGQDHQLGKDHILPTNYEFTIKDEKHEKSRGTYDIDLSTMVFLHCPSDPVNAISCVNLPISKSR